MSEFIFQDEIDALNSLDLPDNAVIFDVGCSYGEYTLEVAKKMNGRPFTAYCFEPNTKLWPHIAERLTTLNYKIIGAAVSDKCGCHTFIRIDAPGNQAAEGCSTLYDRQCFKDNPAWKSALRHDVVNTVTIDSQIAEFGIKHIDLMKIDVEGAELSVFRGAKKMFEDAICDIIQFEYNDAWKDSDSTMREVIDFIKTYPYFLADFKSGEFVEIKEFVEDYGFHNYYLVRK